VAGAPPAAAPPGRGRSRWLLLLATLALCVASMLWRGALLVSPWFDTGSLILYTGSLERADAILYGCAAAVAVRAGLRLSSGWVWPALAVLVVTTLLTGVSDLFVTVGLAVTSLACALVVLAVDAGDGESAVRRALRWRPLVLVGVVSYGLYLWHYPLIYVAFALGPGETMAGRAVAGILVTAVAATASYRWVEAPVRSWVRTHEERLLRGRARTRTG
jgi:peptidoglycan/LPS O-acetylase OafA/YrhL